MIHQSSDVQSSIIGKDTQIWQYVVILEGAQIGWGCNINCHCFIENDVAIGNNVTIKSGVYIWDGIIIEDDVFIGPNVTFTNDMYPRSKKHDNPLLRTVIKKGASIGAGTIIKPGIIIGEYALVGAGSLISKDIGSYELWYGSPAALKGYVCKCGSKLNDSYICHECKSKYTKNPDGKLSLLG